MLNKKLKFTILFSVFCFLFSVFTLLISSVSSAADNSLLESSETVKYSDKCISDGDCELNDIIKVIIRVSEWILAVVGSLALLFFIYGGVMFLISSGSQERVTQAKQIIVGAVIGIVIVFTSYIIINFVAQALGIETSILKSDWFK